MAVGIYFSTPQYKTFSDENIQVEIPTDVNFVVNTANEELGKTLTYTTDYANETEVSIFDMIHAMFDPNYVLVEPFTGITILSIDPVGSYAQYSYDYSKKGTKESFSGYKTVDNSKHDYNGTIYDLNNQTGLPSVYAIVIFNDHEMTIKILSSTDLDTVIRMAETLKIK